MKVSLVLIVSMLVALSALSYQRNEVWRTELALCRDVIRMSPAKARGHNNLGLAYWDLGRDDLAVREYTLAIASDPSYAAGHSNLGIAYAKQGQINEAVREFLTTLSLRPEYAGTHYDVGIEPGTDEQWAASTASALAHYNLGIAYDRLGSLDAAISEYLLALKAAPAYPDAHINLGIASGQKGLPEKAIHHLQTALQLTPTIPRSAIISPLPGH